MCVSVLVCYRIVAVPFSAFRHVSFAVIQPRGWPIGGRTPAGRVFAAQPAVRLLSQLPTTRTAKPKGQIVGMRGDACPVRAG
eukprot:7407046-Pyramimonas_sp.AAC.2